MQEEKLRSLIRESINEYIKEIDEAGTRAMYEAKMKACDEAMEARKKKIEMAESLEEMQGMFDETKMGELKKEIKMLEKQKAKYGKMLEKMNKGKEVVTEEPTEEAPVEESDVTAEMELGGKRVPKKFKDSDSTDWIEDKTAPTGKFEDEDSEGYFEINESFLKMQKLAGVITEAQYNQKKSLIENQLEEALNKDIRQFGQDLEKRLKQAGFTTIITFHPKAPTEEMLTKVKEDPKSVILYITLDQQYQALQLRGNAKSAKDLEKIVKNYQVAKWNGPKMTFGSGWDAKTKQVIGGFNPGDIVGQDPGIMGPFYDANFYRYAATQTKVATTKGNETTKTKGVNQSI